MGTLQAVEMIEHGGREVALSWHMSSNLFPAPPSYMLPVAAEAIEAARDEDWHREIPLPAGVTWRGKTSVPARAVIKNFRLEAFLGEDI
jgi:hypothetical protein